MERGEIGNDGTMNDKYHWRKAKPEKFNHFSHPGNFK